VSHRPATEGTSPTEAAAATERFVLAHGFTQTARSWSAVERLMAERRPTAEIVAVDLPGHGAASDVTGDLWDAAERLITIGGTATYIGYSMGGRVALHAAVAHPDAVTRLVLIGATAGIEDEDERRDRRAADDRLATRIEEIGVAAFVDEWLRNPLFAGLDDDTARRDDRLRNTAPGLASSLRSTGTGTQTPLWEALGELRTPVLLLVGEHDSKFTAIAERMRAALPDASMQVIADAGHSVHLEQPEATVEAILSWC
jgi:2-succinyl-6-hydroxy-2,4-cyclohexadiene-1-carboxylate synthase